MRYDPKKLQSYNISARLRGYAKAKGTNQIYAVLSDDVGGLTYVSTWIRTGSLVMIPDGLSWAEKVEFNSEGK